MPVYIGLNGQAYTTADQSFAGGGEGDIYEIIGSDEQVAKIYKPEKRTTEKERKLTAMINIKPGVIEQYAWPIDVLYKEGKFVGFIMPGIHGKEKLRNIYVYDKRDKGWALYLAIAKNLAVAVYNVHEIGQVVGDLNPENILVDRQTGLVTLVDADSYHITDSSGNVYRCGVGMPEFVAPELQGIHFPSEPLPTFTKETDEFALSVLMFALLMNGAHPFACKTMSGSSSKFQPIDNLSSGTCAYFVESSRADIEIPKYAPPLTMLPLDIQSLFHRSFVEGHKDVEMRPTAEEWYHALARLEKNLTQCGNNAGHQYYRYAPECPWCAVEQKMTNVAQRSIPFLIEQEAEVFSTLVRTMKAVEDQKAGEVAYPSPQSAPQPAAYPQNAANYAAGDTGPAGGLVFYDKGAYSDGWRYLEAAPPETEFSARWGPLDEMVIGTRTGMGFGKRNTQVIIRQYSQEDHFFSFLTLWKSLELKTAAELCADLDMGGYTDWFLPSIDELKLMYQNLKEKGLGNFTDGDYLSSSEYDKDYIWLQRFGNGKQDFNGKGCPMRVRPVRAF